MLRKRLMQNYKKKINRNLPHSKWKYTSPFQSPKCAKIILWDTHINREALKYVHTNQQQDIGLAA